MTEEEARRTTGKVAAMISDVAALTRITMAQRVYESLPEGFRVSACKQVSMSAIQLVSSCFRSWPNGRFGVGRGLCALLWELGSGRSLHFLRFVVLCGAVRGKDDLQGTQAIEPARARRLAFGHAAEELREHERVHVFSGVRPRWDARFVVEGPQGPGEGVHVEDS